MIRGRVVVSAGGTGGHLFPAEALAWVLVARGWEIHLATDHRAEMLGATFPAKETHIIRSATPSGRDPVAIAKALLALYGGYREAKALLAGLEPAVAVGFGGYPTVPPMLAAARSGVPTVIHDANAVLGRANRLLARGATAIATSFETVGHGEAYRAKTVMTGNPVRLAVRDAAEAPYPSTAPGEPLRLVVFGGSQGARFFSELLPAALGLLSAGERARLKLVQQCRPEDLEGVRKAYREQGVSAELGPFFRDLPRRIAGAHLVLSRSGAGTVAELAVIGRPAIMVPLPHAIDQDQRRNAEVLAAAGGGWLIDQAALTPERLASELRGHLADPAPLVRAAAAAKSIGRADAVDRLADLVEAVAQKRPFATGVSS
ncbi:undecaprenyldiphospho-muramoylpentapeptide beta-N-acetylglucosaminyltransferase [Prosthecomicrobium pneumaticum]|uniref:UDP-N-acetylglucosamine--N-acetylmuramyl-(pentapeptide) pyrophosphoryl-undecaprenol N-acetylglucosamine transferase n=1 Tax=Prosthecomicrobium pneumaticum TaxID=81895 RepID=A0A7W9L1V9_9HYPH|nr:UDP-N-acetylglucosamine--N-acetylmuramyl-(pentapeptide) pyrophosphoryl-undecaprenol N-acetylglucosamine transferase [Prosthecomicrobium pneumaticum]